MGKHFIDMQTDGNDEVFVIIRVVFWDRFSWELKLDNFQKYPLLTNDPPLAHMETIFSAFIGNKVVK